MLLEDDQKRTNIYEKELPSKRRLKYLKYLRNAKEI